MSTAEDAAAVRIQAAWRGHSARQTAAAHRRERQASYDAEAQSTRDESARTIQNMWRAKHAKAERLREQAEATQRYIDDCHRAAAGVIQAAWRAHHARRLTLARRQGVQRQAQWDAAAAATAVLLATISLRAQWLWAVDVVAQVADRAARMLQAWARVRVGVCLRRRAHADIMRGEAARVIQGGWRQRMAVGRVQPLREARLRERRAQVEDDAACCIQRLGRRQMAEKEVVARRAMRDRRVNAQHDESVRVLQRVARGGRVRCVCGARHAERDTAARTLQYQLPRIMVGFRERHSVRVMLEERREQEREIVRREAAWVITLFAKRMLARLSVSRRRDEIRGHAAVRIQAAWRGSCERLSHHGTRPLTRHLRAVRDFADALAARREAATFRHFNSRATRIQAAWRGRAVRTQLAALTQPRTVLCGHPYSYSPIPSDVQGASPGIGYLAGRSPSQVSGRSPSCDREALSTFAIFRERVGLQRDPLLSRAHVMLEDAVTTIQAFVRGCWGRTQVRQLEHRHELMCVVQMHARCALSRARAHAQRQGMYRDFAARFLQRNLRAYVARRERAARLAARSERMSERRRHTAALLIQRQVRRHQAAVRVQRMRDDFRRRAAAAITLQAFTRGCADRATKYRPLWEQREAKRLEAARRHAAATISWWAHARLVRLRFVDRQAMRCAAATQIQKCWRGSVGRQHAVGIRVAREIEVQAARERMASVTLQAWWRMQLARDELDRRRREEIQRRLDEEAARIAAEELRRRQAAASVLLVRVSKAVADRQRLGCLRAGRAQAASIVQRFGRGVRGRQRMIWVLHNRMRAVAATTVQRAWRSRREELLEKCEIRELHRRMAALARTEVHREEGQARRDCMHLRAAEIGDIIATYFRMKPDEVMRRTRDEFQTFVARQARLHPVKTHRAALMMISAFRGMLARRRVEAVREARRAERRRFAEAERLARTHDASFMALSLPQPSPMAAVLPPLQPSPVPFNMSCSTPVASLNSTFDRADLHNMSSGRSTLSDSQRDVVSIDWLQARKKPSPDDVLRERQRRELRWRTGCLEKEEDSLRHEIVLMARAFHHAADKQWTDLRQGIAPAADAADSTLMTSQDNTLFTVSYAAAQEPDIRTPSRVQLGGDVLVSSVSPSPSEPGVRCVPTGVFESVYGRPLPPRCVQMPPLQHGATPLQPLKYAPLHPGEEAARGGRYRVEARAPGQVANIARQVGMNDSLVEDVDLSNCRVSDGDATLVLQALRYNTHVKALNLAHNDLHDTTAQEVASLMLSNNTIQSIDLSNTYLSDLGATHLVAAVLSNPSLVHVDVDGTLVTKGTRQSLYERVRRNKQSHITPGRMRPAGAKHKPTPRRNLATHQERDMCMPSPAPPASAFPLGLAAPPLS